MKTLSADVAEPGKKRQEGTFQTSVQVEKNFPLPSGLPHRLHGEEKKKKPSRSPAFQNDLKAHNPPIQTSSTLPGPAPSWITARFLWTQEKLF